MFEPAAAVSAMGAEPVSGGSEPISTVAVTSASRGCGRARLMAVRLMRDSYTA
ncbi:hypothetical protein GCM10009540_69890 [Streptomyces turgidiscabies]